MKLRAKSGTRQNRVVRRTHVTSPKISQAETAETLEELRVLAGKSKLGNLRRALAYARMASIDESARLPRESLRIIEARPFVSVVLESQRGIKAGGGGRFPSGVGT